MDYLCLKNTAVYVLPFPIFRTEKRLHTTFESNMMAQHILQKVKHNINIFDKDMLPLDKSPGENVDFWNSMKH